MKIAYYLEPWIEMNWPGFRFGSLNGYLQKEIDALIQCGHDVLLIIGDGLEVEAKKRGFNLSKYNYKTIRQRHLRKIFSDYHEASLAWYKGHYTEQQLIDMANLITNVVGDFMPDVVMTWESPIPFMNTAFPNALIAYESYGAMSRSPFPATQSIDFFGLFKDSYICQLEKNINEGKIKIEPLNKQQESNLLSVRKKIERAITFKNPFEGLELKKPGIVNVALIPLQVSGYYAFDGNAPQKSQFDYLCDILDKIPSNTLAIVTEHTSFPSIFTPRTLFYLRNRYKNFFYTEEFHNIKGASQYLLPFVDLVIGTTSSILLQAAILDIPIKVIGSSHISIFSSPHSIHRTERIVNRHIKKSFDHIIYHLMTKYWHIQEANIHNGLWLSDYLSSALLSFRNKMLTVDFYKKYKADDNETIKRINKSIFISTPTINKNNTTNNVKKLKLPCNHIIKDSYHDVKNRIDQAEWISFDIFDTLVQRCLRTPKDIFIKLGESIEHITKKSPEDFLNIRVEAEKKARSTSIHEEININEIYTEINKKLNLSPENINKILVEEIKTELFYTIPRRSGIDLLSYAIKLGKKTFLISDMYLDKKDIRDILTANNIYIPDEVIYVSSDYRQQKHTGNIFPTFIKENQLVAERGLHIGDNDRADGDNAMKHGITSVVIPKAFDLFKKNKHYHHKLSDKSSFDSSLYSGLLISKLYDDPSTRKDGITCGKKSNIGYALIGPILVSFTMWLIERCKEKNIDDIYFLSRDGKIFKKAFDMISSGTNIKANYIYASRRSVNLPSISNKNQIVDLMKAPFQSCTLKQIIKNRLGIDTEESNVMGDFDFDQIVSRGDDIIAKFIDENEKLILANASKEREALCLYLKNHIGTKKDIAIIDIGYKGSMQYSLSELLENKIHGYYLVTMDEIGDLPSSGFLEDRISKSGPSPFWRGVALAEWLTLDGDTSVEKFTIDNGIAKPIFKERMEHDISRENFTEIVHDGAFSFVQDWVKYASKKDKIDIECVKHNLYQLLSNPSLLDIKLFEKTKLEDAYGGRDERWLVGEIPEEITTNELRTLAKKYSWKGAVDILHLLYNTKKEINKNKCDNSNTKNITISKAKKLIKSPKNFLLDSRFYILNHIGRTLSKLSAN